MPSNPTGKLYHTKENNFLPSSSALFLVYVSHDCTRMTRERRKADTGRQDGTSSRCEADFVRVTLLFVSDAIRGETGSRKKIEVCVCD